MYIQWHYEIVITASSGNKICLTNVEYIKIKKSLYYPETRFEICVSDVFRRISGIESYQLLRGREIRIYFGSSEDLTLLTVGKIRRISRNNAALKISCSSLCHELLKNRCFDGISTNSAPIDLESWLSELSGYKVETHTAKLEISRLRRDPMSVYNLLLSLQREWLYVVEQRDGDLSWLEIFDSEFDYSKRGVREIELTRFDKCCHKICDVALSKRLTWHGQNVPNGVKLIGITPQNRVYVKEKRDENFTGFSQQRRVYIDGLNELNELCDYYFERLHYDGYSGSIELLGMPLVRVGDRISLTEEGKFCGTYIVEEVVFSMFNYRVRQRLTIGYCTEVRQ